MCCRCHFPDTCLGCGQKLEWHHRWHCQMEGAWVTPEQCCQDHTDYYGTRNDEV